MSGWRWLPIVVVLLAAGCSSDRTAPGNPPDVPASLSSTSLDGAVALTWTDNSYSSDPANFQNYRVYSTSFNIDAVSGDGCGSSWRLEGTTVAPEFLVGALTNGISHCFSVSAVSLDGSESGRSEVRHDTPRPDARNVAIFVRQVQNAESGFRFWDDFNGDLLVQDNELGLVRQGSASDIDFSVDQDGTGALFFTPVRPGTGVELYSSQPVEDLTSIDFAPCLAGTPPDCQPYTTTPIEISPGFAYVFEMEAGDQFLRYGAVRVTHVGQTFIIFDWAFQTDPGNPELLVGKRNVGPAAMLRSSAGVESRQ